MPIGERFSVFGRVGIALMSVDADATVSIDGESASDGVSTDRSNLMYGIGGEFSFNGASASGSAGTATRKSDRKTRRAKSTST